MLSEFDRLIDAKVVSSVDRLDLSARSERSTVIPDAYRKGSVGRWLTNDDNLGGRVWMHQAKAMTIAAEGCNLVISTGTASGKSLVFQSAAFRVLDRDEEAAVIVFYPLKALSNDQLKSWQRAARSAGIRQEDIVKVDGDIPRPSREKILENARVALMTPDICQA